MVGGQLRGDEVASESTWAAPAVCGTLHLTLRRCEFVKGSGAGEALTVISSCQLGSVSRGAS